MKAAAPVPVTAASRAGTNQHDYLHHADLGEPIHFYVFPGRGFQLQCDLDQKLSVIFLSTAADWLADGRFFDVSLSWRRAQVLEHLGAPSKSGPRLSDPILGEYGGWDRFSRAGYAIHVEYEVDAVGIRRTLMRNDVVPP